MCHHPPQQRWISVLHWIFSGNDHHPALASPSPVTDKNATVSKTIENFFVCHRIAELNLFYLQQETRLHGGTNPRKQQIILRENIATPKTGSVIYFIVDKLNVTLYTMNCRVHTLWKKIVSIYTTFWKFWKNYLKN